MKDTEIRWGWVDRKGHPQNQTYATAEAAIAEMDHRQGEPHTLEEHERIGFRLARVKVTVEVLSVMSHWSDERAK